MRRATRLLAIVVVAGCGRIGFDPLPVPVPDAGTTTRLVPTWNVFDDGTRQRIGQYDTLRGESCTPMASDAGIVCVPATIPLVYADAGCTQPLGNFQSTPDAQYIAVYQGATLELYERGAVLAPMSIYIGGPSDCSGPDGPDDELVALGAQVPLTDLAALEIETDPGGQLSTRSYTTTDGFRAPLDAYDPVLDVSCNASTISGGGYVCAPNTDGGYAAYASDSGCSQPLLQWSSADPTPRFMQYQIAGCQAANFAYATAGTPVSPVGIYFPTDGLCLLSAPDPHWIYYQLAAALEPVPLVRTVDLGARIELAHFAGGGVTLADTTTFDAALGVPCQVELAIDGTSRCMPFGTQVLHAFSDSGCMTPIDVGVFSVQFGCTLTAAPFLDSFDTTNFVNPQHDIFVAGASVATPLYVDSFGCQQLAVDATTEYYFLGAHVDPSMFSAVTVVNGP